MLPKKERLSRQEFNRFFSIGKKTHTPSLQLVYAPHATFHASVVVSKKVAKLAVRRNKIRRRIYDIVRRYRTEMNNTGVFIFLTKSGIEKKTYAGMKEEVQSCMESIDKKFNRA